MTVQIDTTAVSNGMRFSNQTGTAPSAPAVNFSLVFTKPDGLYLENSAGQVIGPFITGTASSGGRTLIGEVTPNGTPTGSFSSIPSTYKKLTMEFSIRSTQAAANVHGIVSLNNDATDANYRKVVAVAYDGTNTNFTVGESNRNLLHNNVPGANATASAFAIGVLEIPQYANTVFQKVALVRASFLEDTSSTFSRELVGSLVWQNTSAVNQIDVSLSAGNFVSGSVLRLYGES